MENSFPPISYAECVKTNSNVSQHVDSNTAPMSWYDQVESYQNSIMSRANSMSTILSDDAAAANCSQRLTAAMHRNSISHSMDSGQQSDFSSDNEQCSKSSVKQADDDDAVTTTTTSKITSPKQQQQRRRRANIHRVPLNRQESIDSCHTSSSVSCADPQCTRDHSQFSLLCQDREVLSKVAAKVEPKFEHDEGILARRQKQIDYGKSTIGYELYTTQVPREKRTKGHPQTPDMTRKYSRRGFDGLIKIWRKQLHIFDPNNSFEPTDSEGQNEMTEGFNTD